MRTRWKLLALTVFVLPLMVVGCDLSKRIFEDPRYIAAKKEADESKTKMKEAIANLEVAKTDEEKVAAHKAVVLAKMDFENSVAKLDKIADAAIQSPASGVIGMLSSAPGIIGTIFTVIGGLYGAAMHISRGNYKKAGKELLLAGEDFASSEVGEKLTEEGKELLAKKVKRFKKKVASKLGDSAAGKVVNGMLDSLGLFKKSRTGA